VDLSNRAWKSGPPCSQATLIASFRSLATTMNFDGLSSLWLRKVTTYVLATAAGKIARKLGEGKGGWVPLLFSLRRDSTRWYCYGLGFQRRKFLVMLLREHPLFSYHGMLTWPPVWTWMRGGYDKRPRGEVGILRRVEKSNTQRTDRCFLYIDYEDASYIGCLLCGNHAFCSWIVRILEANLNNTIAYIGSLDISRLL